MASRRLQNATGGNEGNDEADNCCIALMSRTSALVRRRLGSRSCPFAAAAIRGTRGIRGISRGCGRRGTYPGGGR